MNWKEKITLFQKNNDWESAVSLIDQIISETPEDVAVWVYAIYLLHNIVLEEDISGTKLNHDELAKKLMEYFSVSKENFKDNSEYLFFMGVIGHIAEYYFGQKDLSLARSMTKKSVELEPENKIYKWQYLLDVGTKESIKQARQLAKEILEEGSNEKRWLEHRGFPGNYILDVQLAGTSRYEDSWIENTFPD